MSQTNSNNLIEQNSLLHIVRKFFRIKPKKKTLFLQNLNNKDMGNFAHSKRVSKLAYKLANTCTCTKLTRQEKNNIKLAALLHDIGKLSVPTDILNNPNKLTDLQMDFLRAHSKTGYVLLKSSKRCKKVSKYVLEHHEKWDGTGYPQGLKGKEISLPARIITMVDSYDAMISERPYKKAMTNEEAIAEIKRCSGTHFDPSVAKTFVTKVLKAQW